MKVLNLQCEAGHSFEGWFQNEDDFLTQQKTQRLLCPMCDSPMVSKMPTSPRLNLRSAHSHAKQGVEAQTQEPIKRGAKQTQGLHSSEPVQGASRVKNNPAPSKTVSLEQQRELLKAMRKMVSQTEDVGEQFTDMALRMHREELDEKPIRGHASGEQVLELLEEGVAILPLPAILKEPMH